MKALFLFFILFCFGCSVIKPEQLDDASNACICTNKNNDIMFRVITTFDFDSILER